MNVVGVFLYAGGGGGGGSTEYLSHIHFKYTILYT